MIIVLKHDCGESQVSALVSWIREQHVDVHVSRGTYQTVLGLVGDTSDIDGEFISSFDIVESVQRISAPFKCTGRKLHPKDSVVEAGGVNVGSGFVMIAGPCAVESEAQIMDIAARVKQCGAHILRGGAFKPRTSPYDFQGLGEEGIKLLVKAGRSWGLPVVTEIVSASHLPLFEDVDIIQVGARNMQNFELLRELGKTSKPILLKRGLASTVKELLMSAEYIMAGGNDRVILCERGIRTFETYTRNTLDLSAVPILKELSHLPVIVDPSHGCGISRLVKPMAMAAAACGADGLMIEVHSDPVRALSDGAQSITPEQYRDVVQGVNRILGALES